jgi:serine/threonine protein kinase/tetratricopeptide (TPR) repeat protein
MTSSEQGQHVAEIVKSALERTTEDARVFLDQACTGDPEMRAEVDSLLKFQAQANGFIEQGALNLAAEALAQDGSLAGEEMIGEYKILSKIGAGGMGDVYLAEDIQLGRKVALKLVRAAMSTDDIVARFRHEGHILASLNDPNIAHLYGGGVTANGIPFFVMEYVEGLRIDEYCDRRDLTTAARLQLFRKVCSAVHYAHQHLVIHRDLKPSNILVTEAGEPKLLDFGIAKLLKADESAPAVTLVGVMTPDYASPEQVLGHAITTASDVYSLGVIFYELLTGHGPYQVKNRNPGEIARAITDQEPARPSTANAKGDGNSKSQIPNAKLLRGDLDNIALMALRKDPARRYQSVGQFSADIQRHLDGLPVIARNDTVAYRTSKFVKRHPFGVAAAALILLSLVGGIIATTWQARVARQERDHARIAQTNAELAQKQAERLNGFLQTLLSSANPETGPGRDLKVVQVLDQASDNLDHELAGEPALRAQAHLTIGQAYAGLREAKPSISHLRAALEIDRQIYGDENIVTARVKAALGAVLVTLARRYDEAEPLLHQALTVERRQPPTEQRELPLILNYEGKVLSQMNRIDEAKTMAAESLLLIRKSDGEQSVAYANELVHLASLFLAQQDNAHAEMPYRQAIAIFRRLHAQTPSFAAVLTGLAYDLILEGKLDEPEGLLLESQQIYRSTVGEQSIAYALTLGCLGWFHFQREDYPKAEAEFGASLAIVRSSLVPRGEQDYVGGTVGLALAMTRDGKAAEAEPMLRESLKLAKANHLEGTALPENVSAALGECLLAQKRYAEAEPLLLSGYAGLKMHLGEHNSVYVPVARRLHELYTAWNKPAEAARFAVEANPPANPSR